MWPVELSLTTQHGGMDFPAALLQRVGPRNPDHGPMTVADRPRYTFVSEASRGSINERTTFTLQFNRPPTGFVPAVLQGGSPSFCEPEAPDGSRDVCRSATGWHLISVVTTGCPAYFGLRLSLDSTEPTEAGTDCTILSRNDTFFFDTSLLPLGIPDVGKQPFIYNSTPPAASTAKAHGWRSPSVPSDWFWANTGKPERFCVPRTGTTSPVSHELPPTSSYVTQDAYAARSNLKSVDCTGALFHGQSCNVAPIPGFKGGGVRCDGATGTYGYESAVAIVPQPVKCTAFSGGRSCSNRAVAAMLGTAAELLIPGTSYIEAEQKSYFFGLAGQHACSNFCEVTANAILLGLPLTNATVESEAVWPPPRSFTNDKAADRTLSADGGCCFHHGHSGLCQYLPWGISVSYSGSADFLNHNGERGGSSADCVPESLANCESGFSSCSPMLDGDSCPTSESGGEGISSLFQTCCGTTKQWVDCIIDKGSASLPGDCNGEVTDISCRGRQACLRTSCPAELPLDNSEPWDLPPRTTTTRCTLYNDSIPPVPNVQIIRVVSPDFQGVDTCIIGDNSSAGEEKIDVFSQKCLLVLLVSADGTEADECLLACPSGTELMDIGGGGGRSLGFCGPTKRITMSNTTTTATTANKLSLDAKYFTSNCSMRCDEKKTACLARKVSSDQMLSCAQVCLVFFCLQQLLYATSIRFC